MTDWNVFRLVLGGVAAGACFVFAFLLFYRGGRQRASVYFGFCNLFLGLWNVSDIFTTFTLNRSISLLIDRSSYFFATWLVGALFLFCRSFLGPSFSNSMSLRIHLLFTGVLSFLSFTPLIIKDVTTRPEFIESPGPLFWAFAAHMLLTTGYCLYTLRREWLKAEGDRRNRIKYVFLAFVFGALTAVMYVMSMFLKTASRSFLLTEVVYVSLIPVTILRSRMMDINLALRYTLIYLVMGVCLGLPLGGLVWMLSGEGLAAGLALVAPVAGYFAIQNLSPWFIGLVDRLPFFQGKYTGLRNLERQERHVALSGNMATWAERLLEGAFALVKPELGFVLVRQEAERAFLVKAEIGLDPTRRVFLSVPFDSPLVKQANERKIILADAPEENDLGRELGFLGVFAVVPLLFREKVYAFLCLGPKVGRDMLNDVDLAGLYGLARSAELTLNTLLSGTSSVIESKSLAHDLLRPLGAKGNLGALERLAVKSAMTEDEMRLIAGAQKEVGFLRKCLSDFLTDGKSFDFTPAPFLVQEVFGKAIGKHRQTLESQGVAVDVDFPGQGILVKADPNWIERRVIDNLLDNAARHTPPGGRIEIGGRVENGSFVAWVKDTGPGIAIELQRSIFEPGIQGEGKKGLAGLGLYSVKSTVEAHGGRVWAESAPGQGATFYFTLPLADKK